MNPPTPEFSPGGVDASGNRPSPTREQQGPRPSALKVNKDSRKIRKPAVAPPPHHPPLPDAPPKQREDRKPVIIYDIEPRVIHTTAKDFKRVVQLLTGMPTSRGASSSASGGAGVGNPSPAAKLATRPCKEREITENSGTTVEMGRVPGILLQPPPTLSPLSPGFFPPPLDTNMMGYNIPTSLPLDPYMLEYNMPTNLRALDPYMMGYNMSIPSPSTVSSDPTLSPSPSSSSADLSNPFFDI